MQAHRSAARRSIRWASDRIRSGVSRYTAGMGEGGRVADRLDRLIRRINTEAGRADDTASPDAEASRTERSSSAMLAR